MSEQKNPQPNGGDKAWFFSKFLVIQILGFLGIIGGVGVAMFSGALLFFMGGMMGKFGAIPAAVLVYMSLIQQKERAVVWGYRTFLVDDAVKLGFETEESARRLKGLPPKDE